LVVDGPFSEDLVVWKFFVDPFRPFREPLVDLMEKVELLRVRSELLPNEKLFRVLNEEMLRVPVPVDPEEVRPPFEPPRA
jgi:hypothetical protein